MTNHILIEQTVRNVEEYIQKERYRGYDPYDALSSPLFKLPFFKSNKIIRFGMQQVVKRSPINLRRILFTKKGYNPVTLGLCIQAYTYLSQVYKKKCNYYINEINLLIDELIRLQSHGYSGVCWGYDFDWEGRYVSIPAYTPTVVATGIIVNALFVNYQITGNQKALDLCVQSVDFVLKDLNRIYEGDNFCFSYSPIDKQIVFNASMKGARLLSQVYSITKNEELIEEAKKTISFVMNYQDTDGAWSYAHSDARTWVDNYHTGYILDCLSDYITLTGDSTWVDHLNYGFSYYRNNFFEIDGMPKFYDIKKFPADCTAASQSILTLSRFDDELMAKKVSIWTINNMFSSKGYFYFRMYKSHIVKTSFMRWSNAWMLLAFAYLLYKLRRNE